ncbi:MAG: hypothetical protein H7X93_00675 [Sphingomonadaceae bacterium]|nr:hypothetical protein [Sphingomonadaceae bacterium]
MVGKLAMLGAAALLAVTGIAATGAGGEERASPEGRIYHYIRSNRDGSMPEHIHVYRAAAGRLEVYKMVERCTGAALVTAWIDPTTGQASRMTGGRLMPEARHEDFATLLWNAGARRIDAHVVTGDGVIEEQIAVADTPWHLYDFDLASLSVQTMGRADPRADFRFGLPLAWNEPNETHPFLSNLGRADAHFVREEQYQGRPALRFEVGGPALGQRGGPLWIDAEHGHVLGAEWGVPNHAPMTDFALRLVHTDDGGAAAWTALLTRHFEGCPSEG